jgi:hypothetical protein
MEKLQINGKCFIYDASIIYSMLRGHKSWLKNFIPGLKVVENISKPLMLYCDNEPAVFHASNNKSSVATKKH